MFKNIYPYLPLSLISFCLFTFTFHAAAYAQDGSGIHASSSTSQAEMGVLPTPTIYTAPSFTGFEGTEVIIVPTSTIFPTVVPRISPSPTALPSATPTPTIKPTSVPTSAPAPKTISETNTLPAPEPANLALTQPQSGSLDPEKIFSLVNAHRQSIGVAPLVKDERTCSLAAARAPEIAGELSAGTLHSGMYGRNLPYWNTENAIAMGPEEAAVNWWLSDYIHRVAIENPAHTVSCVACTGVYCVQEFTSYQPK